MTRCITPFLLFFVLTASTAAAPQARPLTPPLAFAGAKTLHVLAVRYEGGVEKEVSELWLAKPNRAYAEDTDRQVGGVTVVYASDGRRQTEYRKSRNLYTRSPAAAHIGDIQTHALALSVLTDFYTTAQFAQFMPGLKNEALAEYFMPLGEMDGHTEWEVVTVNRKTGLPQTVAVTSHLPTAIFDSEADGSVKGEEQADPKDQRIDFHKWELNIPISSRRFAYTPPATAKLYVPPKLLKNGTMAPNFTVQDKDGRPVKLSDYLGKTVILDFWATWCGPCQMSMPHTANVARRYASRGVVALAVNVWDSPAAFEAWLPEHPMLHFLHFAIDPNEDRQKGIATKLYGVSGIPTQYVIRKNGKIARSILGYEPHSRALERALRHAGIR